MTFDPKDLALTEIDVSEIKDRVDRLMSIAIEEEDRLTDLAVEFIKANKTLSMPLNPSYDGCDVEHEEELDVEHDDLFFEDHGFYPHHYEQALKKLSDMNNRLVW